MHPNAEELHFRIKFKEIKISVCLSIPLNFDHFVKNSAEYCTLFLPNPSIIFIRFRLYVPFIIMYCISSPCDFRLIRAFRVVLWKSGHGWIRSGPLGFNTQAHNQSEQS